LISKVIIERAKKALLNNHPKGGFTSPTENYIHFNGFGTLVLLLWDLLILTLKKLKMRLKIY
jgi:hypothetical protein